MVTKNKGKWMIVIKFMAILMGALVLGIAEEAEAAPGKVTEMKQIGDMADSVSVSWKSVEGAYQYWIEYCENSEFSGESYRSETVDAQYHSARLPELLPGKSYYVRVSALDGEGERGDVSDILETVTAPLGRAENLHQTDAAKGAISFSWSGCKGANAYRIEWNAYSWKDNRWTEQKKKNIGNVNSYKLSGLKQTGYGVWVYPARQSASGYVAYSAKSEYQFMRTLPAKITGIKMLISGEYPLQPLKGIVNFDWKQDNNAQAYEYVVYGYNNKRIFTGSSGIYYNVKIENKRLTNDQFMKIRVRGYVTVNGEKKYGAWSDEYYFAKRPQTVKFAKNSGGGLQMKWSKMKGAQSYTVYASRKRDSGFKKVGITTGNTLKIKNVAGKKLISGKKYFFKVVANKMIGNKKCTSDKTWYVGTVY